jgi:DNA repair protein RadC
MSRRRVEEARARAAPSLHPAGPELVSLPPRRADELPRALRPLAKLTTHGPSVLSTVELLELLVGARRGGPAPAEIARKILRRHGLHGLADVGLAEWARQPGVGPSAAARICAALELARRVRDREARERPAIGRPADVFRRVRHLGKARKEHLVGLYLDAQNGLLCQETLSIGTLNTTRTHPREILYPAIACLAAGFVLVHNHPSGCLDPSPEDVEFTHAVRRAGELMGIDLYDHLIVAGRSYVSLRERGVL